MIPFKDALGIGVYIIASLISLTNDSSYKFKQATASQKPKAEKRFDGLHTLSKQSQNHVTLVAL